ncbi:MAG TPA: hypothetical protein VHG29_10625 [Novosphingobium sp.]|nr:hypothetical protein [Novosphingobium sp.]
MATTGMRQTNWVAVQRPLDPCTRRMMFGVLRPIDYRPTLFDRMITRWNQLH